MVGEAEQRFSASMLWDLQRLYFAERGVDAWRQGEVPHYVTSNPMMANSYAEVVFGLLRDARRRAPGDAPLYVCELGAGSGRFAFHFLSRLVALCERAGVAPLAFRYILTDLAEPNLDFWRAHPGFARFFASGMLDVALFDIERADSLALRESGETITAGSLVRPLVAIANYVFDSIPQDLYYVAQEECLDCRVSLSVRENPWEMDVAELLAALECAYTYHSLENISAEDADLAWLLDGYRQTLTDSHLLVPTVGWRCLRRVRGLSREGVLVLSADKGEHRLAALASKGAPQVVRHGSFSLSVNYHALAALCEHSGGVALAPGHPHTSLNVSCLLMLDDAADYVETQGAYARHVHEFGPDDAYAISLHARQTMAAMSFESLIAYLRLSLYDAHLFARYLPRLFELAPGLDAIQRATLAEVIDAVWLRYFPLGEDLDLADQIGRLLYEIDEYGGALSFFERSVEIYGPYTGTLANIAACRQMLDLDP